MKNNLKKSVVCILTFAMCALPMNVFAAQLEDILAGKAPGDRPNESLPIMEGGSRGCSDCNQARGNT